ncbi:hypothetical protein JZ751_017600 [Albula glossodonta]|uniref:Uncharacterized protein n=1 Tax=Albula glossodonta TaxID=121402 RepID=A0A8T2PKA3_9TELE|nr:hypothetical protein JZ751_017600 [Albula glossodonta]
MEQPSLTFNHDQSSDFSLLGSYLSWVDVPLAGDPPSSTQASRTSRPVPLVRCWPGLPSAATPALTKRGDDAALRQSLPAEQVSALKPALGDSALKPSSAGLHCEVRKQSDQGFFVHVGAQS